MAENNKIPLIAVVGPTASGKTALSIELAKRFNGEIVSADSMQIYKGLHIASAAPDTEEMQGIKHHLIEFLEPSEPFSVADYVNLASDVISDIYKRGKLPVLVGGTGLYVNSLIDGISFTEEKTDSKLRDRLSDEYDLLGGEEMLKRLGDADPEYAQKLHSNDKKRIVRAFEIMETTSMTVSENLKRSRSNPSNFDTLMIGINYKDRQILYGRINLRVDKMIESGLIEEAKTAFSQQRATCAQAIGHKEIFPYIKGEKTLQEAAEELKKQTRHYAKRQITWFGRDERVNWVYPDGDENVIKTAECRVEEFLKRR